jgi:alkylation response protein AidB-like acyl-CoA dehydrogenase
MAAGERIVVLAHAEPNGAATVCRRGDDFLLDGRKCVVAHAAAADLLSFPPARRRTRAVSRPRDAAGLSLDSYPTLDGSARRKSIWPACACRRRPAWPPAMTPSNAALDIGLAALCAEAVGIMKAALDATTDYLRTRQQFGQPIGRFQALQHRAADMLLHYEQAKSMSYLAAMRCTSNGCARAAPRPLRRQGAVGRAARFIGQQAVQLHGGMGMTDELVVSHWFKRLTAIEMSFGDSDSHLQRFARLSGSAPHDGCAGLGRTVSAAAPKSTPVRHAWLEAWPASASRTVTWSR